MAITMPGVQKPHCSPCCSWKARCTGCIIPSLARPSAVVISCPLAWAASTVHDFTDSPSSSTVQAPHEVVSQPMFVAVRSATSRTKCTSSMRSSTSAVICLPLTVRSTFTGYSLSGFVELYRVELRPRNSPR